MSEESKIRTDVLQAAKKSTHVESRERFETMLAQQNAWMYSEKGLEGLKASMAMLATKTGRFARIPLICKTDECPYSETCFMLQYSLAPKGEYCPVEVASIEKKYHGYDKDFGLEDGSATDNALIDEIITLEMIMERCISLMAKEEKPVVLSDAGINERGDVIQKEEVSKALEAYQKASKERDAKLQLMMGTRKDKKDTGKTRTMYDIMAEMAKNDTVDAEFKEE